MTSGSHKKSPKTPYIVATGFTTAFLGDERTLREFIIGDDVSTKIAGQGENVVLYLINDSYDPLDYRQLRVGVNKDEKLLKQFEGYCGRPISEIPDPFGCHDSYSRHFTQAHLKRLHALDIHPVILDCYRAYQRGHYTKYVSATFENYSKIQEVLSENFAHYTMKNLFRVQCPKCLCIDSTHIRKVNGQEVHFTCERCASDARRELAEIRGKLSWKLDCAARWNLYGIDLETFSKAHVAELGSFEISRFMSQQFYGGKVPALVKYGDVKISRELSYQLLEMLPPKLLKRLFTTHPARDLDLNKDFVENFCRKFPVRPGVSYVDYIRRELPQQALCEGNRQKPERIQASGSDATLGNAPADAIDENALVAYGNRFSRFYYGKDYRIRFPDAQTIASVEQATAAAARHLILDVLSIRNAPAPEAPNTAVLIKSYLLAQKISPRVYPFLRRIFGQSEGPSITTLLAILPADYLNTIQTILAYATGDRPAQKESLPNPQGGSVEEMEIVRKIHRIAELAATPPLLEIVHEKKENLSPAAAPSRPAPGLPERG